MPPNADCHSPFDTLGLRQNMPQSGCKTFSFIFKYKAKRKNQKCLDIREIGRARDLEGRDDLLRGWQGNGNAFSIMFSRFSGSLSTPTHMGHPCCIPYLLRAMIYYNFMHESLSEWVYVSVYATHSSRWNKSGRFLLPESISWPLFFWLSFGCQNSFATKIQSTWNNWLLKRFQLRLKYH